jgi:hypothetical protein
MQIAVRPNPTDAILHGAPERLLSLIKPFEGFASDQKKLNALCCRVSRISPVVSWAREAPVATITAIAIVTIRFMRIAP